MELSGLGGVQRTVHVTEVMRLREEAGPALVSRPAPEGGGGGGPVPAAWAMFPALLPRLLVDFDDTSLLSGHQTDVLSSLLLLRASINL